METQEAHVALDQASRPFEGRWNRLISTTNWEKGRIIFQWRAALKSGDAPATEYSDEAWSARVGGVTGQHVGRLRRVYERFGEVHDQFEGLYWSHFQAALDWDDAEMWLEGAIQEKWSVANMRKRRWEALGAPDELKPRDEDIVAMELNEDLDSREDQPPPQSDVPGSVDGESRSPAGPDFGDEDDAGSPAANVGLAARGMDASPPAANTQRIFENLPQLPDDLAEAFEAFKLAIIRHKSAEWNDISQDDVLSTLEALKKLALAPTAAEAAPF